MIYVGSLNNSYGNVSQPPFIIFMLQRIFKACMFMMGQMKKILSILKQQPDTIQNQLAEILKAVLNEVSGNSEKLKNCDEWAVIK